MSTCADGNISILRLMRIDKAINQWYIAQFIAIVLGLFLHAFPSPGSLMEWGTFEVRAVPFTLLYFTAIAYFIFIVVMTGIRTKSSLLCMTMPLSTRRIWLSRILSILSVSQLPIILVTLVTAYRSPGGGEPVFLDSFTLKLGFHTCASMAMLTMLLQLPSMELGHIVKLVPYVVYAIFISFVVVFATLITVGISIASWVFLLAAVILALWILMKLPPSFSIMPVEPDPATQDPEDPVAASEQKSAASGAAAVSPALTPFRLYFTIAHTMVNRWSYWMDCVLLVFYSMMAVLSYYDGAKENPWWLLGFIWIFAALMQSVQMLNKIDSLPVSRRLLFGMTMTPIIFAMLLGMGFGFLTVTLQPDSKKLISYYDSSLQIPKEFYEITEEGPPPVLTSMWGEVHEPEAYPFFAGSDRYIYKPFDTGPESSPRFIALQIDRAAEAVHGIERDPLEKYGDLDDGSETAGSQWRDNITKSIGRSSDTRSRVFALAGILSAAFYSLVISLQIRYGGRSGPKSPGNFIVPAAVIIIFLIIISVVVAGRAGLCKPSFVEAVPSIYARGIVDALPFSTPVLWTVFAAVCVTGYFLLQSAFRRFEAPLAQQARKKAF